jgi:PEP-CTERM motif
MGYSLHRVVAACSLAALSSIALADSTVTVRGDFYQYEGPVGAPIYAGSPPYRDPAPFESFFRIPLGPAVSVKPMFPHPGYESTDYIGSGSAVVNFYNTEGLFASPQVAFWNTVDGLPEGLGNSLEISGTVTAGVAINPATHRSDTFHLATIHYDNGSWFRSQPSYDPGLGPLYGVSRFAFALVAEPVPFIGTPTNPGGVSQYHFWNDTLVLTSTFGVGTPDLLTFENNPGLGTVSVGEGIRGSFEIWGQIGSLEPVELRNASTGVTLLAAVPEPETYAMLTAGLGLVLLRTWRRKLLAAR